MDRNYQEPEFRVVKVNTQDVITTSIGDILHLPSAFTDWETRTYSSYWFN